MTERLHFDFSLSCTGEGNGSPRQCSCLENPRDGGAWWAAVYGVTESDTTEAIQQQQQQQQQPLRLDNFNCLIDPFFLPAQISYGTNSPSRMKEKLRYFPGGTSGKEPACQCRQCERSRLNLWVRKIPWRRKWHPLQYSRLENPCWLSSIGSQSQTRRKHAGQQKLSGSIEPCQ